MNICKIIGSFLVIMSLVIYIKYCLYSSLDYKRTLDSFEEPQDIDIRNLKAVTVKFDGVGCAAYSKELGIAIFINTSTSPYKVSTNVIDFIKNGTPLNNISVVPDTIALNNINPEDVVWSYKKSEFLLSSHNTNSVYTSPDGITWNKYQSDIRPFVQLLSADKLGVYVIKTANMYGNAIYTSTNGIKWIKKTYGNANTPILYDDDVGLLMHTNAPSSPNPVVFVANQDLLGYYKLSYPPNNTSVLFSNHAISKEYGKTYLNFFNDVSNIIKMDITNYPNVYQVAFKPFDLDAVDEFGWCNSLKVLYFNQANKLILRNSKFTKTISDNIILNNPKDIGLNGIFSQNHSGNNSTFVKFV